MKWELELSWQLGIALGITALLGALIAYLITRACLDKSILELHEENHRTYTKLRIEQAQNIE